MAVALGVKAQSPTVSKTEMPNDSVSIMFHSLQNTNAEMARLNRAYNTHATMISIGGALQLIGTGMTLLSSNESMQKVGMISSLVGMGFVVLSILPMPKGVSVDERGLVVDLPSKKKK
jgi:amino acid permease